MIRKVVDRVHSVVDTNFNTFFATLASEAGVPALTPTRFKRLSADRFKLRVQNGIGVYHEGGATTRRRPGAGSSAAIRDTRVDMVLDWYLRSTKESEIAVQTELAIRASLQCIDLLPDGTNIVHAAEGDEAIRWVIERDSLSEDTRVATERALIRFPCWHRETGL